MRRFGWVVGLGPSLLLAAAMGTGATLLPARLTGAAVARNCPPADSFAISVASSPRGPQIDARLALAAALSAKGEVSGRRLSVSAATGPVSVSLAAESFAAQPVANVVVFGQAASGGSTVSAIDLQTGCQYSLYRSQEVVRSAAIDLALAALYVHRVSATDRADLGVTKVILASGAASRVLEPVAAAGPFGITFGTLLRWSVDGDALAVQSCGAELCRTRVYTPSTGAIETYAEPHGQIVGLSRGKLVAFDSCAGRPCPLVAIDRRDGSRSVIDVSAFTANFAEDANGPYVVATTIAGSQEIRP